MNGSFSKFMTMALVCSVSLAAALPVQAYQSPIHIFKVEDIQGDFKGYTYGNPNPDWTHSVICGIPGGDACPPEAPDPFPDKENIMLYPIDSEFGFYVVDFLGAEPKVRDKDYMEGWAGRIVVDGKDVGVKISNSETARYKVKPPLGTWCQGLGNGSVKCSTEHYSAMEHVLSCHEVIPYRLADPVSGDQKTLEYYPGSEQFDCSKAELDDFTKIIMGGELSETLLSMTDGVFNMLPNDNTTVMDDIALGSDYSVTLKDDGKALYRWGGMIKRPNDIRLYAPLELPKQWKERDPITGEYTAYKVNKAVLKVEHWITNNPNDQLRPEDLENEAATGRKPDYKVDPLTGSWLSTRDCFEGDAHFIDSEEETLIDDDYVADEIPAETYLKNAPFSGLELAGDNIPPLFSKDLKTGFTNAYYTTTNRDPFEWSYLKKNADPNVHQFHGSLEPLEPWDLEALGLVELVSGPRWRLRANKFGQDICGLEIPLQECSPPPFKKDNIKYVVGEKVTTIINLLDWADCADGDEGVDGNCSPLATSLGWVTPNEHVAIVDEIDGVPITSNGLPMTEDFDLAVYIKGDRKPVALFNAWIEIEFEGEYPDAPPVEEWNVAITELRYEETVTTADSIYVHTVVENYGPYSTSVDVQLSCVDNRGNEWTTIPILPDPDPTVLLDDEDAWFAFEIEQNTAAEKPATIDCILEAIVEEDANPLDNAVDFTIKVKKFKE